MYTFDFSTLVTIMINLTLYFMVATIGAFTKDMYNSITKKDEVIRIKRILVGGIFATFILVGIEEIILKKQTLNVVLFISFVMGGVGFELFGKWVNVATIENFIRSKFR